MSIDNTKVVDLNIKKEERILDFSDFQKQDIKFDIDKLQEAYNQIVQIKKFEDAGVTHFGAISLTQIPGDPDSIKGNKARGVYWTKPDKSGKEVIRDVSLDESAYSEFIPDYENTYFKEVYDVLSSKYGGKRDTSDIDKPGIPGIPTYVDRSSRLGNLDTVAIGEIKGGTTMNTERRE